MNENHPILTVIAISSWIDFGTESRPNLLANVDLMFVGKLNGFELSKIDKSSLSFALALTARNQ
jgi:hypothetical protein